MRYIYSISVCYLSLFVTLSLYSQNRVIINSLWQEFESSTYDTAKVDLLNDLATQYFTFNIDSAAQLVEQSINLADQINYPKGKIDASLIRVYVDLIEDTEKDLQKVKAALAWSQENDYYFGIGRSLFNLGKIYLLKGEYDLALEHLRQCRNFGKDKIADDQMVADATLQMGSVYRQRGEYPRALELYGESLRLSKQIGYRQGIQIALNGHGFIYSLTEEYVKAEDYFLQSLKISKEDGNKIGIGYGFNNLGAINHFKAQYDEAIEYYIQSINVLEGMVEDKGPKTRYNRFIARANLNLGDVYMHRAEYDKALAIHERGLKMKQAIGDQIGIGYALHYLGAAYMAIGDYTKAMDYHSQSLRVRQSVGYQQGVCQQLNSIGQVHRALGNHDKALEFYSQSQELSQEIDFKMSIANNYLSIGEVYQDLGSDRSNSLSESLHYYQQALDWSEKNLILDFKGKSLRAIGNVHKLLGDHTTALTHYNSSLEIFEQINNPLEIAKTASDLGQLLSLMQQHNKAISSYTMGLKIAQNIGGKYPISGIYLGLSRSHKSLKQYTKAKEYALLAYQSDDQSHQEEAAGMLSDIFHLQNDHDASYEYAKRQYQLRENLIKQSNQIHLDSILTKLSSARELELQKKNNELKTQRLQSRTYQLAAIAGFSLLLLVALRFYHVNNSRTKQLAQQIKKHNTEIKDKNEKLIKLVGQIQESNTNLSRFAHVTAHDINAPLNTIYSFAKIISQNYKHLMSAKHQEFQDIIVSSCYETQNVINSILQYSTLPSGDVIYSRININELINQSIEMIDNQIRQNSATISVTEDFPEVKGVKELLLQLFINLFVNAIKFSKPNVVPQIEVGLEKIKDQFATIRVSDNGIGIPKKKQSSVFRIFQKLHSSSKTDGSGMGLAIVKRVIEIHQGDIWIKSDVDQGTTFYFTLPLA